MDFEKRLERAIDRGRNTRDTQGREAAEEAMSEEEIRNLHSRCRLDLTEYIETCLRKLEDHFLGFRFETIVGDEGWGAKLTRDDVAIRSGGRSGNQYSRLEMLIKPYSSAHIISLVAKGTVQNRELFNRSHYQHLTETDLDSFCELIDLWVLEYAEHYSAQT